MADPGNAPPAPTSPPPGLSSYLKPLSDTEIDEFYHEFDKENRGFVTFAELGEKLEQVTEELSPTPNPIQRLPKIRSREVEDIEAGAQSPEDVQLESFVQQLFPDSTTKVAKSEFVARVRSWNVPSPSQITSAEPRPPLFEGLRARWEVDGPRITFIAFIVALQLGLGLWQMLTYINAPMVRSAFGWGVILSKAASGAIYPTFFFLLLSMSRYFATFIRRFRYVPRIINWDRSGSTHIWMAVAGLGLSTLHAIGYLTGSFVHGSKPAHQPEVQKIFDPDRAPSSYAQFIKTLPGWTGVVALGLYWIIAITSLPIVRAWSWELFQLGHVLMFPMIGLLCAHGTSKILQQPMLGYWLAIPLFLVLLERSSRLAHGCRRVLARLEILDEYTVTITFDHPRGNWWNYEAGQYIFLQVPSISYFQWHPFTVSSCNGKMVQVHIQTSGNWTKRLRKLTTEEYIRVGVDGPFGAPSQRFYEFDRAIVLGAGVGITPFSAIMTDLEQKLVNGIDPWAHVRHNDDLSRNDEKSMSANNLPASLVAPKERMPSQIGPNRAKRRVDFHWVVREKEDLLWFSTLLNRAHDLSLALPESSLALNISTYITTRRKDLSTHVFRYLLDSHRPHSATYSLLTGLKMRSRLGRPDFGAILLERHNELKQMGWTGGRVGVFFCGSPQIGRVLAEACTKLTAAARKDGSRIRYIFMMEVFG